MTVDLGTRSLHRAWYSLIAFVPAFVLAFVVGEGLVGWFGYSPEDPVPLGVVLAAAVPALLIFVAPGATAVYFGRRAVARGRAEGRVPVIVGVVIAGGFVLLNLLALVVGSLTG